MATKGKAQDLFRAKAPDIMALLLRDFPMLGLDDVAAMLGNFGHECAGFTKMQEIAPTVKGSRGGFGWAQWTGPRRRSFEAYCERAHLNPASDKANYGFLFSELKGPERKAIDRLRSASTLGGKVKAFELAYERAGVKHYESRNQWAAVALDAWAKSDKAVPEWAMPGPDAPAPAPPPVVVEKPIVVDPGELEKSPGKSKTVWTWLLTILGTPVAVFGGLDWRVQLAIVAVIVAFGVYGIKRRFDLAKGMRQLRAAFEGE